MVLDELDVRPSGSLSGRNELLKHLAHPRGVFRDAVRILISLPNSSHPVCHPKTSD